MIVYILTDDVDYEGSTVLGVYSTPMKAMEHPSLPTLTKTRQWIGSAETELLLQVRGTDQSYSITPAEVDAHE